MQTWILDSFMKKKANRIVRYDMEEFDITQENTTEDKREEIKRKLRQYYDGRI